MVTWLWIVGFIALIWPFVVVHLFEGNTLRNMEIETENHLRAHHAVDLKNQVSSHSREILELRQVLKTQDALIAALWEKSIGHDFSEGGFVGDKYVSTTHDFLTEAWGTRPPWTVETDQVSFAFNYLKRHEKFPWGEEAAWLRRD